MEEEVIEVQDGDLDNTEDEGANNAGKDSDKKEVDYKAEAAKWKRIAQRKASKTSDSQPEPIQSKKNESSDQLDYGQKAFLKASGLNGADEIQLAKEFAKRTGEPLDVVVEDDIFKARLDKLRTTKSNEAAAESGANRGNNGAGDPVEKVLASLGPNDPIPDGLPREVREKVVEARRQRGAKAKTFYND